MFGCTISTQLSFGPSHAHCCFSLLASPAAVASGAEDIPLDAPQDALMAGPAEIQEMQDWASVGVYRRASAGA